MYWYMTMYVKDRRRKKEEEERRGGREREKKNTKPSTVLTYCSGLNRFDPQRLVFKYLAHRVTLLRCVSLLK